MKKTDLPPANILHLVTTVERVYSEPPTWLLAVGMAIGMALLAVVSCSKQRALDEYQQCLVDYGTNDARCAALNK